MKFLLLIFLIFNYSLAYSVQPGDIIKAEDYNNLNSDIQNLQNQINSLKNTLNGNTLIKETLLWSGNRYLDGSSTYNLWNSSKHQSWDAIRVYVAYDSNATAEMHEIDLTGYSYNSTSQNQSTLITTYDTTYRRIIIRTTGIDVYNGNGGGWYLRKVIGIKKLIPSF